MHVLLLVVELADDFFRSFKHWMALSRTWTPTDWQVATFLTFCGFNIHNRSEACFLLTEFYVAFAVDKRVEFRWIDIIALSYCAICKEAVEVLEIGIA